MNYGLIDFDSGMHGHFLEYICNKYIFNVFPQQTPFFSNGSSHAINLDQQYQQNKKITSGHFTSQWLGCKPIPDIKKIIYIKPNRDFYIVNLINVFHRCFKTGNHKDIYAKTILEWHFDIILKNHNTQNHMAIRTDLFDKFGKFNNLIPVYSDRFDFDFGSFFNFTQFLTSLQELSKFLNHTLILSSDLYKDWQTFIDKNDGYQTHLLVDELLKKIVNNQSCKIPNDVFVHAYLNYNLSNIFRLYDGQLHDNEEYPADTSEIHKIIQDHLVLHDNKF
jgi:hypothetical protein